MQSSMQNRRERQRRPQEDEDEEDEATEDSRQGSSLRSDPENDTKLPGAGSRQQTTRMLEATDTGENLILNRGLPRHDFLTGGDSIDHTRLGNPSIELESLGLGGAANTRLARFGAQDHPDMTANSRIHQALLNSELLADAAAAARQHQMQEATLLESGASIPSSSRLLALAGATRGLAPQLAAGNLNLPSVKYSESALTHEALPGAAAGFLGSSIPPTHPAALEQQAAALMAGSGAAVNLLQREIAATGLDPVSRTRLVPAASAAVSPLDQRLSLLVDRGATVGAGGRVSGISDAALDRALMRQKVAEFAPAGAAALPLGATAKSNSDVLLSQVLQKQEQEQHQQLRSAMLLGAALNTAPGPAGSLAPSNIAAAGLPPAEAKKSLLSDSLLLASRLSSPLLDQKLPAEAAPAALAGRFRSDSLIIPARAPIALGGMLVEDEEDVRERLERRSQSDSALVARAPTESSDVTSMLEITRAINIPESFPVKLHRVLSELEKRPHGVEIASFLPHGRAFAIHDPKTFATGIMRQYFRMNRFASFQRQLNLYDFQRINEGRDKGAYFHELFLQGRPALARRMKRTKIKGENSVRNNIHKREPIDFYRLPPVSAHEDDSPVSSDAETKGPVEDQQHHERLEIGSVATASPSGPEPPATPSASTTHSSSAATGNARVASDATNVLAAAAAAAAHRRGVLPSFLSSSASQSPSQGPQHPGERQAGPSNGTDDVGTFRRFSER